MPEEEEEIILGKDLSSVNKNITILSTQYKSMKHNHAGMAQGVSNIQMVLDKLEPTVEKMYEKIVGDEKFGNLGIIQILQNQDGINKKQNEINESIKKEIDLMKQEKILETRMEKFKDKLYKYLFGIAGGVSVWIADKVIPMITHLFHF
jgi:chaperonin cofactor prefoldin